MAAARPAGDADAGGRYAAVTAADLVAGDPPGPSPADPAAQLALEEALVRARPARPVLRIWRNPPTVVVGRFQDVGREAAVRTCARDGVPVLRRVSGGGTVYQDLGNLNVSLVLAAPVPDALRLLVGVLAEALGGFVAVRADARGLFAGDRKLAGFAALHTPAATLVHASVLVATPSEAVRRYLAPAPAVPSRRDSHRVAVASLREHGCDIDVAEVAVAVLGAAGGVLRLRPRPLTPGERAAHAYLLHHRYRDPAWHLTGHGRGQAWTTASASSSTGRWS